MKNKNLKRTICTALAGLMLTLTACGEVKGSDTSDTGNTANSTASSQTAEKPAKDIPEPVDISVKPLSNVVMTENENEPDDDFKASFTEELKECNNVLISPESVMMALGMTANGAKGETLSSMEAALGGTPIDKLNNALQYRMTRFNHCESVSFNVANSLWANENRVTMQQEFCDKLKEFYNAESYTAPFDNTTLDDINGWVSNNTKGMIPEILDEIPPEAVIYLVNAIAFEGEWNEGYTDEQIVEDADFTNSKGEIEKVNMMYSEEGYYIAEDGVTGFIKPYMGYEYGFMALLPEEGTDLADFAASLDGDKLRKYYETASGVADVCIPEFSFDYDNELSDELTAMGMGLPFSDNADFSDMGKAAEGQLKIGRVLHKTHIELDREGTRAAAATAVEMFTEGAIEIEEPKRVYLDRPFAYAIVDMENGTPIFIGGVNTIHNS